MSTIQDLLFLIIESCVDDVFYGTDYNSHLGTKRAGMVTFDHEKGHLAIHIAKYYDIDPYGEEYQYLTGDIGKKLFPIASKFMCKHCRQELTTDLFDR